MILIVCSLSLLNTMSVKENRGSTLDIYFIRGKMTHFLFHIPFPCRRRDINKLRIISTDEEKSWKQCLRELNALEMLILKHTDGIVEIITWMIENPDSWFAWQCWYEVQRWTKKLIISLCRSRVRTSRRRSTACWRASSSTTGATSSSPPSYARWETRQVQLGEWLEFDIAGWKQFVCIV